jgi:hypothetical protein
METAEYLLDGNVSIAKYIRGQWNEPLKFKLVAK